MKHAIFLAVFVFLSMSLYSQKIESIPWKTPCDNSVYASLSNENIQFMGGLELFDKSERRFGGLSAIWAAQDGSRILAFSDYSLEQNGLPDSLRACWYEFIPLFDSSHRLRDIKHTKTGHILKHDGSLMTEIESVASDGKTLFIARDNTKKLADKVSKLKLSAFDNSGDHRVCSDYIMVPKFPKKSKEGFEAMDLLPDGKLLLIQEVGKGKYRNAWIIDPKSDYYHKTRYKINEKTIKAITPTRDGNLLILEKIYKSGSTRMAITRLECPREEPSTLKSKVLLRAKSKCFDNFEGITTFMLGGEEYFFLISDNNGDWQDPGIQKTLLLLFKLK